MSFRGAVFPVLVLAGCGGKATSNEGMVGQYAVEGACVSTFPKARSSGDLGSLQGMGHRHNIVVTLSAATDPEKVRFSDSYGCSLLADQQGDVVRATDINCDALPQNSSMWVSGFETAKLLSFYLNRKELRYHYGAIGLFRSTDPTDQQENHYVCEGRLNGGSLPAGVFALRYEGETNFSVQQPDPVEQGALPGCTNLVGWGSAGGSLLVHFGSGHNELVIYEEGVGCTVTATSQDGVVFRADGAECALNDIGISLLGVQSRKFDSYSIDFSTRTWTYSSTLMQMRSTGVAMPYCLKATAKLIGDLPK